MDTTGRPTTTNLGTKRHTVTEDKRQTTLDITDVGDRADIKLRTVASSLFGVTNFEVEVAMSLENTADIRAAALHLWAIADRLDADARAEEYQRIEAVDRAAIQAAQEAGQ